MGKLLSRTLSEDLAFRREYYGAGGGAARSRVAGGIVMVLDLRRQWQK